MKASAEAVWKVLADGWLYPSWVVGASRMRAVDPQWPAVGAELHHSQGAWPLLLNDSTHVLASVPGHELVLHGNLRPVGEVDIRMLLEPMPGACMVTMEEDFVDGLLGHLPSLVRPMLIGPRNRESLRRLAYLAEGGSR